MLTAQCAEPVLLKIPDIRARKFGQNTPVVSKEQQVSELEVGRGGSTFSKARGPATRADANLGGAVEILEHWTIDRAEWVDILAGRVGEISPHFQL